MENIYKVKIKTNPDPRGLYPSERRYSASIVLGLSVVHLIFCGLALIFALLTVLKESSTGEEEDRQRKLINRNNSTVTESWNEIEESSKREIVSAANSITSTYLILTTLLLTIGCLLAGLTGLLAWKRWYIDNNIKWFFVTSLLASILSTISIICAIMTIVMVAQKISSLHNRPRIRIHLHVHILIMSVIELVFAVISTVISYTGMTNSYPDDVVIPKETEKIEVNTVLKGNRKSRVSQPDIINHFHVTEKFAKHFPHRDSNYLPNAESNVEYEERVRQFLSSNTDSTICKY